MRIKRFITLTVLLLAILLSLNAEVHTPIPLVINDAPMQELPEGMTVTLSRVDAPRNIKRSHDTSTCCRVTLTEAGTLSQKLGTNILSIDSLYVTGPIDSSDFNAMWDATFNGALKVINLSKATIEGGKIPDKAFFHVHEQIDWNTLIVKCPNLEMVVLPENITSIGSFAFAYCFFLKPIDIPASVRRIEEAAFTDNLALTGSDLKLPDSLEYIGKQAFFQCTNLNGELILPEKVNFIDNAAFYRCPISKIHIPQSVKLIGGSAFAGSRFKEVYLADDCELDVVDGSQFNGNWNLEKVHYPESFTAIPPYAFYLCTHLVECNIPRGTQIIGSNAFDGTKFTSIDLPEGLQSIGIESFASCAYLEELSIPASVTRIGRNAFTCCGRLKNVYCKATIPPEIFATTANELSAFSRWEFTLYVPIGSRTLYSKTPGWKQITNIVELTAFPESGIDFVHSDAPAAEADIYNLQGIRISSPQAGELYIQNGKKLLKSY